MKSSLCENELFLLHSIRKICIYLFISNYSKADCANNLMVQLFDRIKRRINILN